MTQGEQSLWDFIRDVFRARPGRQCVPTQGLAKVYN